MSCNEGFWAFTGENTSIGTRYECELSTNLGGSHHSEYERLGNEDQAGGNRNALGLSASPQTDILLGRWTGWGLFLSSAAVLEEQPSINSTSG